MSKEVPPSRICPSCGHDRFVRANVAATSRSVLCCLSCGKKIPGSEGLKTPPIEESFVVSERDCKRIRTD